MAGMSATTLITEALQMLQVYDPGETLSDEDAATGLAVANDMLDSWSAESLACFAILETSFPLVVGKGAYTIGLSGGADVAATRPIRVITGPGAAYLLDGNGNRYSVNPVPRDEWNLIGTTTATSDLPDTMFYDPQLPLGIINIWPVPSMGWTLYFDSYLQLTEFPDLTTAVNFPPGYPFVMKGELAQWLKPYFKTAKALDPVIVQRVMTGKATIKRANLRPNRAVYDPEIVARAAGTYNIYRDSGSAATD